MGNRLELTVRDGKKNESVIEIEEGLEGFLIWTIHLVLFSFVSALFDWPFSLAIPS